MAIEKNAVREGTRWMLHGGVVEVLEVTPRSVIYASADAFAKVMEFDVFVGLASDPATAEHDHLLKVFGSWSEGMPAPKPRDLHQAISYLLTRFGPPAPANIVPAPPAPKPSLVEDEPVAKGMPAFEVEDYAVTDARCEPLHEDKPADRKRFSRTDAQRFA